MNTETQAETFSSAEFRQALGLFPTGVVVIAAVVDGVPVGLAVNSFTSVSLDPPLIAFCPDKGSTTWPVLRRADSFSVSVLAEDQDDVCLAFAGKGKDRFAGISWAPGHLGHPLLHGAVAWLECDIHRVHDAGDHELVLGRVHSVNVNGKSSLVFHAGRFARLTHPPLAEAGETPAAVFASLHGLDVAAPFFDVLSARLAGG